MQVDAVRKLYDGWAAFYNPTHRWTLPKRRAARLAVQARAGDKVLDLACGTGLNFRHLRELVGPTGHVTGIDLSPRMLDVARRTISSQGWENVDVVEADAARLPFPDGSFDRVICTFALNVIPGHVEALKEIRRVLAPDGCFVALEVRTWQDDGKPNWMGHMASICAVDPTHRTLDAIKAEFADVEVEQYWGGMFFLAKAWKRG